MGHRDLGAIAVAALALLMASGVWVADALNPSVPSPHSPAELDRPTVRALEAQPEGAPLSWRDARDGTFTTVVAAGTYSDGEGHRCRPFTLTRERDNGRQGGETRRLVGCRIGTGHWRASPAPQQIADAGTAGFDRWLGRLTDQPR